MRNTGSVPVLNESIRCSRFRVRPSRYTYVIFSASSLAFTSARKLVNWLKISAR